MNIQQYYYDNFIDATNQFIGGDINSVNVGIGGTTGSLSEYLFISSNSNLYLANSNINGEIKFQTLYEYPNNNDVGVKIDSLGKLQVYHNYNIAYPLITQGYFNVEDDLAGLKQSSLVSGAEMLVVQGQISGIQSTLTTHTFQITEVEAVQAVHTAILQEDLDNYNFFEEFMNFGTDLDIETARQTAQFRLERNKEILNNLMTGVGLTAIGGAIAGIYNSIEMKAQSNLYSNVSNGHITQSARDETTSNFAYYNRRSIIDFNSNLSNAELENGFINSNVINQQFIPSLNINQIKISDTNVSNIFVASNVLSNINLNQGFINSNLINQQFIPELKSNKLMLGTISTPNLAYQMEMTGDLNLNELYRNSTSLTSLLNQKQDNMSATQPIYITTGNIGLNYDSSLTKIGNNLSVIKTASLPLVISGNNWTLNYDSSLNLNGNNLSVIKTASLPLVISGNNWTLNYDSTLTLSGNNLKVADATASKWTASGNIIYNNNAGNVGIGTTNPSYKLHIEDGSLFVGDSAIGNGSQTDNGYRLVFDSSYTATGANKCNKILLHKNDNAPTYIAGFGIEAGALAYSVWTGGNHNFYTSATTTSGGFLSFSIYRDNFRNYGSVNGGAGGVISNGNNGTSAYSYVSLANDIGNGILFLNSSTKTTDGGANTLTLRNDITGGDLRLSANLDTPYIYLKKSSGNVGIGSQIPAYKLDVNGSLNSTSLYISTRIIQDHLFNNSGRGHNSFSDFNTPTDFGCHFIQGTGNSPSVNGAGQYYSMSLGLGNEYYNGSPSGNYKTQIAIPRNVGNPYLCVRYMENGGWGGWNKFASGVADNATSSTFSIRSPNEGTNAILYLGTPFDANSASKCAIIAQGLSSYSRSKLHFCLNGTADNSSTYQASLVDGSFTFDYNGNMGLMNQSPPNIGGGDYSLHLGNSAMTTTSGNLIIHKRDNSGGTRLYRIGYDGYFWTTIGDSGNNNSLSSWIYQFSFPYNCPTNSCYLTGSGGMVIAGTLTQNSDQRIKTDIKTIDNSLWKLSQLRGVYYTHIIEGTRNIGLIAQEVLNIIPEVVYEGERNDLKSISYGNLVALLIEAIKEQQEIINNQEKKINDIYEILSRNGLS